jgi:phage terminase small subunit
MIDPALIPKNPAHQRFSDRYLAGDSLVAAYLAAGFKCSRDSAYMGGKRMLKRKDIQAYIKAIQSQAADDSVMTLLERRRFYARIKRTPIMAIDPNHPQHKDGDLIRKYKRTTDEFKDNWEIEKLDPLKACELDTKAAGEDTEANGLSDLAAAIRSIGSASPIPSGRM